MRPFRKYWNARKVRQAFGSYLSEETIRALTDPASAVLSEPERREIDFLILQVRDNTAEETQQNLSHAISVVIELGGIVEGIMSSIVSVTLLKKLNPPTGQQVAEALLQALGSDVKVVHGCIDGLYGRVGSRQRWTHGAILPRFGTILDALRGLEFGEAQEIGR